MFQNHSRITYGYLNLQVIRNKFESVKTEEVAYKLILLLLIG
jgi:hypothetical protein